VAPYLSTSGLGVSVWPTASGLIPLSIGTGSSTKVAGVPRREEMAEVVVSEFMNEEALAPLRANHTVLFECAIERKSTRSCSKQPRG